MLSPRQCGEIFVLAQRLSKKDGEVCGLANQVLQLLEEVERDVRTSVGEEDRERWLASYYLSIFISNINEAVTIEEIVGLLRTGVRDGRIRRLLHDEPEAEDIRDDEKRRGLVFLDGDDAYIPANFEDSGACAVIIKARKRSGELKHENNRVRGDTQ